MMREDMKNGVGEAIPRQVQAKYGTLALYNDAGEYEPIGASLVVQQNGETA